MIVSPLLHWIFFFQKYLNVLANIKWVLMEMCVSVVFSVFHRHGVSEAYCFAMMNKRRHRETRIHLLGPENAVSTSQESQSSANIPAPPFSSPSSGHSRSGGVRTQVCNMGKEEKCKVGRGEEAICAPSRP